MLQKAMQGDIAENKRRHCGKKKETLRKIKDGKTGIGMSDDYAYDPNSGKAEYNTSSSGDKGYAVNKPSTTKEDKANAEPTTYQQQQEKKEKIEAVAAPVSVAINAHAATEVLTKGTESAMVKGAETTLKVVGVIAAVTDMALTIQKYNNHQISFTHAVVNFAVDLIGIEVPGLSLVYGMFDALGPKW